MQATVNLKVVNDGASESFNRAVGYLYPGEKERVLRAVGAKFKLLSIGNFGRTGTDRPEPWKSLSPKYAKKVGRSEATLELSGELFRSLRVSPPSGDSITVYS